MALDEFLDYVFGGDQAGFFALSLFKGGKPTQERFLRWPEDRGLVNENTVGPFTKDHDVYFTPALFKVRERTRAAALGSWVGWVDADAPVPSEMGLSRSDVPPAGIIVASGTTGRSHRYWRSERFLAHAADRSALEGTNRELAKNCGADPSGIDAAQLLRLPDTFNHKTKPPKRVYIAEQTLSIAHFDFPPLDVRAKSELALGNLAPERWEDLGDYTQQLFNSVPVIGERSSKLYELACRLFEEHFLMEEVRTVIDEAATKWGKFDNRSDRNEQLDTIVHRAQERTTPPIHVVEDEDEDEVDWSKPVSFSTLLSKAPSIEWIIPGILRKKGLLYIVGPTGVGKSTFALNLCLTLALRRESYLGLQVEEGEPEKVLFASLEMDRSELLTFLSPMSEGLDEPAMKLLDENMYLYARGQSLALEEEKNQRAFEDQIKFGNYTGLVLDTLGASTKTSLQDESGTRKIADWIDKIRQKLGVWVVVLAHPRKAPAGVKNHIFTIDDAYGARIFGDRANTVLLIQRNRVGLQLTSVKTRFMSGLSTMYLNRGANHWFEITTQQAAERKPALIVDDVSIEDLITDAQLKGDSDDFDL